MLRVAARHAVHLLLAQVWHCDHALHIQEVLSDVETEPSGSSVLPPPCS